MIKITAFAFTAYPVTDLPRAKADYNLSRSLTLSRSPGLEKENDYENENDSALDHRSL
ncbi:MAG: hypothetical protein JNG82_00960 [Opitutaceae bacterium]|nr:hypothetical protein [Opitutaceae bacterium]